MKKIYLSILLCFFGYWTFANPKMVKPTRMAILDSLIRLRESFQAGIFERIIEQAEIEKANTFNSKNTFTPYIEIHKLFYRFSDFDREIQASADSSYFYTVGKVFVSERYRELDYRSTHRNRSAFAKDNDGFYYYCKLYYHEQLKDFRIVIYPGMVQNVCQPYMHFNRKTCPEHALVKHRDAELGIIPTKTSSVHEHSIRSIIEIPDALNEDFIVDNSKSKAWRVNDTKSFVSQTKERYKNKPYNTNFRLWGESNNRNYWSGGGFDWVNTTILNLFFLRNNTLKVSLNLSKQMKIFKIVAQNGRLTGIALAASKNTNNEDFSYRTKYDLTYKVLDGIPQLPSDVFIQSEDKGLVNIITSAYPNDHYMAGKNRVYRRLLFITTGNSILDSCIGAPDFNERLVQKKEEFKRDIDNRKIALIELDRKLAEFESELKKVIAIQQNNSSKRSLLKKDIEDSENNLRKIKESLNLAEWEPYIDLAYKEGKVDTSKVSKMLNIILEIDQLKKDVTLQTGRSEDAYGKVKTRLIEYDSIYRNGGKQLGSAYSLNIDTVLFSKEYSKDILNGDMLHRYDWFMSYDSVPRQVFVEGLTKILEKKGEMEAWNGKVKAALDSARRMHSSNMNRLSSIRKYDDTIDDIMGSMADIERADAIVKLEQGKSQADLKSLEMGRGDQLEKARQFQSTFLPDHPSLTKYFVYIDSTLAKEMICQMDRNSMVRMTGVGQVFEVNISDKIALMSDLFSQPVYVRGGLPVKTSNFLDEVGIRKSELSEYLKGQIMEVYNPYDINRRMIRQKYKGGLTKSELHRKAGWQTTYHQAISDTLEKQRFVVVNQIDPATNKITGEIPSTSAYRAAPNVNTIWTVLSGGREYYWLQISNELFDSLRYMNWYFYKYDKNPNKVM